jgi:hypothetical protein
MTEIDEYSAVNTICRTRARSGYKIVGNRVIGTSEENPVILDAIHEESDFVTLTIRIKRPIYEAFRAVARARGRSISSTLARALNRSGIFLLKKLNETGTAE